MSEWTRVKWSEAGQVLELAAGPRAKPEPGSAERTPAAYFRELVAAGRLSDAVRFLGHALPRLEAVAWAARSVNALRAPGVAQSSEAMALKAALLWVQDPCEVRRRAAFEAAEAADSTSPERLAAMAAFYSGGSVTPADCAPVPAPRGIVGRLAAAAVLAAAAATDDMSAALRRCLHGGEQLATKGIGEGGAA